MAVLTISHLRNYDDIWRLPYLLQVNARENQCSEPVYFR